MSLVILQKALKFVFETSLRYFQYREVIFRHEQFRLEIEFSIDRKGAEVRIVTKCLISVTWAVVLSVLAVSQVDASCTGGNRISHRAAECLDAEWDNGKYMFGSAFTVRNMCPVYGKVVAKIDLKGRADKTWHLGNGDSRTGESFAKVRWIHCCRDLGELCNYSDVVTSGSCRTEYNKSTAANSCTLRLDPTANGKNCNFILQCDDSIVVASEEYLDVHDLGYCSSGSVLTAC